MGDNDYPTIRTIPPPGSRLRIGDPITRGLRGLWLFNGGAGSRVPNLADPSGDTDGVFVNTGAVDWGGSPFGSHALTFDNTNGYLDCGFEDLTFGDGDYSFAALVRSDAGANNATHNIIGKRTNSPVGGFQLFIGGAVQEWGVQQIQSGGSGFASLLTGGDPGGGDQRGLNEWQLMVGQRVGDAFELYGRGILVASGLSGDAIGTMLPTTSSLRIGIQELPSFEFPWLGAMAYVVIWERHLNPLEIFNLHLDGPERLVEAYGRDPQGKASTVFFPIDSTNDTWTGNLVPTTDGMTMTGAGGVKMGDGG